MQYIVPEILTRIRSVATNSKKAAGYRPSAGLEPKRSSAHPPSQPFGAAEVDYLGSASVILLQRHPRDVVPLEQ